MNQVISEPTIFPTLRLPTKLPSDWKFCGAGKIVVPAEVRKTLKYFFYSNAVGMDSCQKIIGELRNCHKFSLFMKISRISPWRMKICE